jgi:hypothetical protein
VSPLWTIAGNVTATAAIASLLVWLAVQVPRYRRSSDECRHQLKWLYTGASVYVCALIAALVGPSAAGQNFASDGPAINDVIELGSTNPGGLRRGGGAEVPPVRDRPHRQPGRLTEAVVAAFTGRLRQTVDFDTVWADLIG